MGCVQANDSKGDPISVQLDLLAVNQLWPEVMDLMKYVIVIMKPFLLLFGITENNGLSPFALCEFNTLGDLR